MAESSRKGLVGEICGWRRALASRCAEEPAELPARGVERSLLIFAAVIKQWSAVLDHLEQNLLDRLLSQRRIAVEIADELPTERPHVVNVFLDGLRR